jgi:hypothetical protein
MADVLAVLGFVWLAPVWTAGTIVDLTSLPAWLVWAFAVLWLYGHFDRPVEFAVRRVRMRRHGFAGYSDYVRSTLWRQRAGRWYATHGRPPCCVCAAGREPGRVFHLHHVDRLRAGSGREPDRDLVPVCARCHTLVHKVERRLYALAFTLRASTWLVRHAALPVRVARRVSRRLSEVRG